MNLRQLAEQDLSVILEDSDNGFGWAVQLTDPLGDNNPLTGYSNDIGAAIDPETGQIVAGNVASVALRISSLAALGLPVPRGVADAGRKPWIVRFDDLQLKQWVFKIEETMPDRTLGMVVCILSAYAE